MMPLNPPLTILVTEGRWDAVGEPTPWNLALVQILKEMGGVSDTTAPGTYHFNVEIIEGTNAYVMLEKVD